MSAVIARIKAEPAVVGTLLAAAFAVAVSLGLDVSGEVQAAVIAFATVVVGLFIRAKVTPVQNTDGGF